MTRLSRLLAVFAAFLLISPALAADKPLVMEAGKIKQLPANTTLQVNPSGAAAASINIPQGSAPTSPNNGDCWTTTSGLFCRINGATIGPYSSGTGSVSTTGSPASGNLAKFSGATSVTNTDLTGDVTTSGGVATTLTTSGVSAGSYTNANITVDAKGRVTAASNGSSGSVTTTGSPASGNLTKFSGATSVTNADLSGDVTTSGTLATTIANNAVTTAKINNNAVTLAKIANAAANSKLVGSGAAGSGAAYSEITLGTNLSMSGTTLNASGGTTTNALTITSTGGASPGATFDGSAAKTIDYSTVGAAKTGAITSSNLTMATNKVLGRSTASTGSVEELTVGSGLLLSGGTLSATSSGVGWQLAGTGQTSTGQWSFSIDGAKSTVDFTGLSGAHEIMCWGVSIQQSVAGVPFVRVSTNNGSSYFSGASDYGVMNSAGATSNSTTSTGLFDTAASNLPRSFGVLITLADSNIPKPIQSLNRYTDGLAVFQGSTSPINAIRFGTSGGGNFNSGSITCYTR